MDLNIIDQLGFSEEVPNQIEEVSNKDIAVIGFEVVLPNCEHKYDYWSLLASGDHGVSGFPPTRKADTDAYFNYKFSDQKPSYRTGGYLGEVDKFDPAFFGMSPKEAALMDPHQRLFLQTAYHAIEDGGYSGKIQNSETGIYLGYAHDAMYRQYIDDVAPHEKASSTLGNLASLTASRLAYMLNLQGPSMVVDTACSSSLTALHLACQGLRNGDCETAIVGAVNLMLMPIETGDKIGIESEDGYTRAFDAQSTGTGLGEGVIAIMLKPLSKAMEDNDNVWGVIKGSAINQDGRSAGISAPNGDAQQKVLVKAWRDAGINPRDLSYIEAHGTGTKLGDPIEVSAINGAFKQFTPDTDFCQIGSAKTNLGHLDSAAGLAGLTKVLMCLKNEQIVPSLFFNKPNPSIQFNGAVSVATQTQSWTGDERYAGVSAFGLSGTNCHIVLQAPPASLSAHEEEGITSQYPFFLSAKTELSLSLLKNKVANWLKANPEVAPADLSFTSMAGRAHHDYRLAVRFSCTNSLVAALECEYTDRDKQFIDQKSGSAELNELIDLFESGSNDFADYINATAGRLISMPGYAFEPQRCWVSVPEQAEIIAPTHQQNEEQKSAIILPSVAVEGEDYSSVSEIVANIWGYTLDIDSLSLDDDYYALGGDSIFGLDVQQLVKTELNVNVELHELLEHSVFKDFVALVESRLASDTAQPSESNLVIDQNNQIPLSFAQKRLWFLEQLEDLGAALNLPTALEIKGDLDTSALQKSIEIIIQTHPALKARFLDENGTVNQVFDVENTSFDVLDVTHEELDDTLDKLANQRFDLNEGRLFSPTLLRLNASHHILLINCHHIIVDGWSIGIMIQELGSNYAQLIQGINPSIKRVSPFSNYAVEQQSHSSSQQEEQYWGQYLNDLPTKPWLPTDYPRPAKQSHAGATLEINLDDALSRRVKDWSKNQGLTLYMTLKAAFDIALSAYSGHTDIVVGTPVSGRESKTGNDWRQTIGLFINNIVLRSQVSSDKTLNAFLSEVKHNCVSSFANQAMPFERLVELLQPERDLSSSPLFQVMFALQNSPTSTVQIDNLTMNALPPLKQASQYDLTLNLFESADTISGAFEYCCDLFDQSSIKEFSKLYIDIVSNMIEMPEATLEELTRCNTISRPITSSLAVNWCANVLDIHTNTPEQVAFEHAEQTTTYRDLVGKARQLADDILRNEVNTSLIAVLARTPDDVATAAMAISFVQGQLLFLDGLESPTRLKALLRQTNATAYIGTKSNYIDDSLPYFELVKTTENQFTNKVVYPKSKDLSLVVSIWDHNAEQLKKIDPQELSYWLGDLCLSAPISRGQSWLAAQHDDIQQLALDGLYPVSQGASVVVSNIPSAHPTLQTCDIVKGKLASDLPTYMVPSEVIVLDALPTTPNGKIDKKALPNADEIDGKSVASNQLSPTISQWYQRLQHAPMLHSLPLTYERKNSNYIKGTLESKLPESCSNDLSILAASHSIDLQWLLLALQATTIAYRGYETSLVMAVEFSNHTKPLAFEFVGEQSLVELASALSDAWGSLPHWDSEQYCKELALFSDAYNPVYQIGFGDINANLDLQLISSKTTLKWQFDQSVFDAQSINDLDSTFVQLATQLLAYSSVPASQLTLIDPLGLEELKDWNSQTPARAFDGNLVSLFSDAAVHFNNRTATNFIQPDSTEITLSYAEVDARSTNMAKYLVQSGVNKGDLVGLYLSHSDELLISLIAVLKAGAAYVPLDPSHPIARNATILDDASCKFTITHSTLKDELVSAGNETICIDSIPVVEELIELPTMNHKDLAYVIYTSGSTGKPKGVMISHGAAFNFIKGMHERLPVSERSDWLWVTTVSFDIALYEWLGCLSLGHCCVIPHSEIIADVQQLTELINSQNIDLIQTTPSRWKTILDAGLETSPDLLALCGEKLSRKTPRCSSYKKLKHCGTVTAPQKPRCGHCYQNVASIQTCHWEQTCLDISTISYPLLDKFCQKDPLASYVLPVWV